MRMNTEDCLLSALSAPFRPVCPVEPISTFYRQDGQEDKRFRNFNERALLLLSSPYYMPLRRQAS